MSPTHGTSLVRFKPPQEWVSFVHKKGTYCNPSYKKMNPQSTEPPFARVNRTQEYMSFEVGLFGHLLLSTLGVRFNVRANTTQEWMRLCSGIFGHVLLVILGVGVNSLGRLHGSGSFWSREQTTRSPTQVVPPKFIAKPRKRESDFAFWCVVR